MLIHLISSCYHNVTVLCFSKFHCQVNDCTAVNSSVFSSGENTVSKRLKKKYSVWFVGMNNAACVSQSGFILISLFTFDVPCGFCCCTTAEAKVEQEKKNKKTISRLQRRLSSPFLFYFISNLSHVNYGIVKLFSSHVIAC